MEKYVRLVIYQFRGNLTIFKFLWKNRAALPQSILLLSMYLVDEEKMEVLKEMMEQAVQDGIDRP